MDIIVSVSPDQLADVGEVARALGESGLRDVKVLEAAGVITGTVDDAATVLALRGIAGVDAIEESRTFQLPPPDAPIQ